MSDRYPNLARAARNAQLMIVPEKDIYAAFPECGACTWVTVAANKSRLKYINAICATHMHVRRVRA